MIKNVLFMLTFCTILIGGTACYAEDEFDFNNFADITVVTNAENSETSGFCRDYSQLTENTLNEGAEFVNVRQFDIAGAMLGMTYDEINNLFFTGNNLYAPRRFNSIEYAISKDWEYNLDYECRQNNIYIPDRLKACIHSLARNRGLLYVSAVHLERTFTGETIDIYFTSNATDNVVWQIIYKNDADKVEGGDRKFENQREKKVNSFWQGIYDKYGTPNSDIDKWISDASAFEPMMQAYRGKLELSYRGIDQTDCSYNHDASREHFQAKPYAF